jgi:hypothetical protein
MPLKTPGALPGAAPPPVTYQHGCCEGEWGLGQAAAVHQGNGCCPVAMAVQQCAQDPTVENACMATQDTT